MFNGFIYGIYDYLILRCIYTYNKVTSQTQTADALIHSQTIKPTTYHNFIALKSIQPINMWLLSNTINCYKCSQH